MLAMHLRIEIRSRYVNINMISMDLNFPASRHWDRAENKERLLFHSVTFAEATGRPSRLVDREATSYCGAVQSRRLQTK